MAVVKPFICIRPAKEHAAEVAALPSDVYNRKEACAAVKGNPLSFLNINVPFRTDALTVLTDALTLKECH